MSHVERAGQLKKMADEIIKGARLTEILSAYGKPEFTGSYAFDLMTWPDIDVCLEMAPLSRARAFELGQKLAEIPGVSTMYFRDEFVLKTPGNPKAMFWCVDYVDKSGEKWKLDILISDKEEVSRILAQDIRKKLTSDKRKIILEMKGELTGHPDYRKKLRSTDIYAAVLDNGIKNLKDWWEWWNNGR